MRKYVIAKDYNSYLTYVDKFGESKLFCKYISEKVNLQGLSRNAFIVLFGNYHDNPNWNNISNLIHNHFINVYEVSYAG